MDVFQYPVEILAFNYVNFEFSATVQSFLTCIAIVTAAISFWRFRTVGSNSFHQTKSPAGDSNSQPSLDDRCRSTLNLSYPPPMQVVPTCSAPESEEEKSFNQEQTFFSAFLGVGAIEYDDDKENNGSGSDRVIEDKFTLYYQGEEDNFSIEDRSDGAGNGGVDIVCSYREKLYCSDERWSCDGIRLGIRGGDLGWYHSQDLTVFNGSVVRLWDCHRRKSEMLNAVRLLPGSDLMRIEE